VHADRRRSSVIASRACPTEGCGKCWANELAGPNSVGANFSCAQKTPGLDFSRFPASRASAYRECRRFFESFGGHRVNAPDALLVL
jgi:hypothetical protein